MDRRIWNHPLLSFERGKEVTFNFEGRPLNGYESEDVASCLLANDQNVLGWSKNLDRSRGYFCGIGKCSSCLMTIDGIPNVRSCTTPVKEGMIVERQHGNPKVTQEMEHIPQSPNGEIKELTYDVIIVGGGISGISAALGISAFTPLKVALVDDSPHLGGQLLKQTHKFFGSSEEYAGSRGTEIAKILSCEIAKTDVDVHLDCQVLGYYDSGGYLLVLEDEKLAILRGRRYIVATGAYENMLLFESNDLPGIFGAGGLQTIMNLKGVLPGRKALIVGSGNVGLILAYQMLQAGVEKVTIVEAMGKVGGYGVHSQKIERFGVPILLNHTIKRAIGKDRVEGAEIVALDKGAEVPGSERVLDVDMICLAVGLTPDVRLLQQMGCECRFIKELGGWIVNHDREGRTSMKNVLISGDASSIEEATTAMLEGKISGLRVAMDLSPDANLLGEIERLETRLGEFRSGPFSEKIRAGMGDLFGRGETDENGDDRREEAFERSYEGGGRTIVLACSQSIPCDPCVDACPKGAITKDSLTSPPEVDMEKCSGCGLCVSECPGLAIFLVRDLRDGRSLITLPYEMYPFPEAGEKVILLDRNGKKIGFGEIKSSLKEKFLIRVFAPNSLAHRVRNIMGVQDG